MNDFLCTTTNMSSCSSRSSSYVRAFVEVEAADVLASLGRGDSVDNGRGCGGGDDNCGWRSKGKRSNNSNKRLREFDSSVVDDRNSFPLPFDLNLDRAVLFDEQCGNDDNPSVAMKDEEKYEAAEGSCDGVCDVLQSGGRSRQVMSEAEKEARRVRRILANRESAKQTIRRRQAFYEELKRRSAELASENEDLKRTKNLAVQEFQSLQATNHNLNKIISSGLELGKNSEAEIAITPILQQFLVHKFLPNNLVLWEYVQPSEVEIPRHSNWDRQFDSPFSPEMVIPSHINSCRSNEQENSSRGTSQQMPWCILPFPWLLSVTDNVKGVHQSGSLKMAEKDPTRHVYSPSSVIPRLNDCQTSSNPRVAFQADSASLFCPSPLVKTEGPITTTDTSRKKNDAVAASAEARKRRRKVIKLKSLHYDSHSRRRYG